MQPLRFLEVVNDEVETSREARQPQSLKSFVSFHSQKALLRGVHRVVEAEESHAIHIIFQAELTHMSLSCFCVKSSSQGGGTEGLVARLAQALSITLRGWMLGWPTLPKEVSGWGFAGSAVTCGVKGDTTI